MDYVIFENNKYFVKDYKDSSFFFEEQDNSNIQKKSLLDLSNLGIKDISEVRRLETLTSLKILYLDNNQITEIKGLETLTNLRSLHLYNNQITEINGLETLTSLEELYLDHNQITEINGLETLTSLEELYLDHNQITEIKGLGTLTNLRRLNLSKNHILEIKGLDSLINLWILDLSYNRIKEIKGLESLTNLRSLHIYNNQITKIKGLKTLTNLHSLYLSDNYIIDIEGLDSLINLRHLGIDNNQLSEIKGLNTLRSLKTLELRANKIKEIKGLENLTSLQELVLEENKIAEIKNLDSLKKLELLDLVGNPIVNGKEIANILKYKNLEDVELDYQNLRFINPEEIDDVKNYLNKRYNRLDQSYKRPGNYLKNVRLLDEMIKIANLLVNLYGDDDWEKKKVFVSKLKKPIEDRIAHGSLDSKEQYKLLALKNILFAGIEREYQDQLYYLEEAINYFKKAGEIKCEFFHRIYYFLIKSLKAHSEDDIRECKNYIENILELYPMCESLEFHPSLKKLIDELPAIQDDLIKFTQRPNHWQDLIEKSSLKCAEIMQETFPQIKYSKPGIYRIMFHLVDDMRRSWKKISISKEEYKESIDYLEEYKDTIVDKTDLREKKNAINHLISAFELKIRQFIKNQLKKHYGVDWWDHGIPQNIREIAENRKSNKEKIEPKRTYQVIDFLTLMDYSNIILKKKNWNNIFRIFFNQKYIFQAPFENLTNIRNDLAHNRFIEEDFERCKTYIEDILRYIPDF